MAARKKKVNLSDNWKDGIRVSMLMGRLLSHAQGEVEMTSTQIKAADIILRKLVPDLARTELAGDPDAPIKTVIEWQQ